MQKKFLFLFLLCVLQICLSHSQPVRFNRIGTDRGLSTGTVYCSFQDSQGFMWFGTEDGLNKYDGYSFEIYKSVPSDSLSLSNNTIRCIYEDSRQNLWVGTDRGLNLYNRNNGNFQRYLHDAANKTSVSNDLIYAICEDPSGTVWIGTNEGLNRVDALTGTFSRFEDLLSKTILLSSNFISALFADSQNRLWIGTAKDGINVFNIQSKTVEVLRHDPANPNSLSEDEVNSICGDMNGNIWIGTVNGGLNKYSPESGRFRNYTMENTGLGLGSNSIFSVLPDPHHQLWIGTHGGGVSLLDLETEKFRTFTYEPQNFTTVSSNKIWNIFEDHAGTMWISTSNGVSMYNRSVEKFMTYRPSGSQETFANNNIYCVYEDHSKKIWCGVLGSGLKIFDRASGTFSNPSTPFPLHPEPANADIFCITSDKNNVLWLGTSGGLVSVDASSGRTVTYKNIPGDPKSIPNNDVRCVVTQDDGTVWLGTYGGGLSRLDPATGIFITPESRLGGFGTLSSDVIKDILVEKDGIWIATYGGGLSFFQPSSGKFTTYRNDARNPKSISSNFTHCLFRDSKGILWIGTYGGGLNSLDGNGSGFTSYSEGTGMPNNIVNGILEDKRGFLWISTNNGICRFQPDAKGGSEPASRFYRQEDGLQNKFNENASLQAGDGQMIFGGSNGLNAFHPDEIHDNTFLPPLVITRFYLFEKPQRMDTLITSKKSLTLSYSQNFFSFEYAALNFLFPEKNRYAYRMEGLDADWNYVGSRRFIAYTNLDPGTYVFRLKASNNDGYWNEKGIRILITITPPFWKTWWFTLLAALLLAFCIYAYIRYRTRSLRKQTVLLEQKVATRTSELREKNVELTDTMVHLRSTQDQLIQSEKMASLGQLTAGIAHEIQNPLNFVNNFSESSIELIDEVQTAADPEERKEILGDLRQNLQKVVHHGKRADSIVKGMLLHSRAGVREKQMTDVNKLVEEFIDLAYHGMRAKDPGFNCTIEKSLQKGLPEIMVLPQDISRVLLNLFNNAFYAVDERNRSGIADYKRVVKINTASSDGKIQIRVRDNGKGIPKDIRDKIFQPFFTTKPTGKGTGLGLSISYDIIKKGHGGEIRVDSKPDDFTEFLIELPLI